MDKFWTDERVEKLKTFWALGHSAGVIAKQLGCTRNSVIGKSNRLKLEKRGSPTITNPKPVDMSAKKKIRTAPEPVEALKCPDQALPPMTFSSPSQCKAFAGEPTGEWQMCGNPTVKGGQWCECHKPRCTVPTVAR